MTFVTPYSCRYAEILQPSFPWLLRSSIMCSRYFAETSLYSLFTGMADYSVSQSELSVERVVFELVETPSLDTSHLTDLDLDREGERETQGIHMIRREA